MADIKSPEERSRNMSSIRSKETKPELYIRKKLFEKGYRYKKNVSYIFGHPDVWLPKYNTAVFINGCFWHRHKDCKYAYTPKTRTEFWAEKFNKNVIRDSLVREELREAGIRILIVWECTVKKMKQSEEEESRVMHMVESFLLSDLSLLEL